MVQGLFQVGQNYFQTGSLLLQVVKRLAQALQSRLHVLRRRLDRPALTLRKYHMVELLQSLPQLARRGTDLALGLSQPDGGIPEVVDHLVSGLHRPVQAVQGIVQLFGEPLHLPAHVGQIVQRRGYFI